MVRYSRSEKKDMYDVYIKCNRNSGEAAERYLQLYPGRRQPSLLIYYRIALNMAHEGNIEKKRGKYLKRNTINEINVLSQVYINPETSSRAISRECGVSASTVKNILKKHKYHDYKFQTVQKLHPGDYNRRIEFCRWYKRKLNNDVSFHGRILWTDESTFTNSGIFNRKNKHFYATDNPHLIQEVRPQIRFSINLWCGILNNKIIGPIFIDGNLNQHNYLQLLEDMLDNLPLGDRRNIYFMQDGCGPHNAALIRNYLNERFPRRWFGTHGPIRWPPRSPCLNPMDYFVWGYIKNKVYYDGIPNDLNQLRDRIINAFNNITPQMVSASIAQMTDRIDLCIQEEGGHFEQLL